MQKRELPSIVYKLMIVAATVIWGFAFVVMKDTVAVLQPAWLIGIRFMGTALLLTVIFFRRMRGAFTRAYLTSGAVLGVLIFLAFWTQTIGLAYTTPGKNAFLTATYCVMVPFVYWLVTRKRPTIWNLLAAALCIAGMGFVSLNASAGASAVEFGDFMTLICAVFFAIHIVYVAKFSATQDVIVLTVWQFWVGGLCGLAVGALTETPPDLALLTPDFLFNMFYLVVFASSVALLFQNVALAHVPPAQGSLLLSLESVFGVVFSVAFYGEELTLRLLLGFALIFGAIIVSEIFPLKKEEGALREREADRAG